MSDLKQMENTAYMVIGGVVWPNDYVESADDLTTVRVFKTPESAEVYRQDLLSGTTNSESWVEDGRNSGEKYCYANVSPIVIFQ